MLNQQEESKIRTLLARFGGLSRVYENNGTPNGVITESPGAVCLDSTSGLWVKETGINTNTGWVKK
jgi:hypothetical protein